MKRTAVMMVAVLGSAVLLAGCGKTEAPETQEKSALKTSDTTQGENEAQPAESAQDGSSAKKAETNQNAAGSGEKVELTYWQHSSAARDEMMKELVAEFETQNPDITVKLEFIPEDDYSQKLIPSLATDTAPDVFQIQSGMLPKLAKAGAIQPLDETVMPAEMIEREFIPAAVEGLRYEGRYYGMPTDVQTILLFWNKTLAEEAGLDAERGPQTWEEFFDWARKMTKRDGDTLIQSGWGGKGYVPELLSFIEQKGGKFYDGETGRFVFADDEAALAAIEEYASLYKEDKVYDTEFVKNWAGFRQGLIGMMLGHPAMIGNLPQTAPELDFGVGLIPASGDNRATCLTSWGYVAGAKAPSAEATRLIEFLSSEAVEKKWTKTTGELPARAALLEDEELGKDPKVATAIESLKASFVSPVQIPALHSAFSDSYTEYLKTDRPLAEVMREAQEKMNAELANPV